MFFLSLCWFAFSLAFQSDILVLKNGKSLACDEYTVADGRVTIVSKGQRYAISEKLVDWNASQKARESRAQEQNEARIVPKPKAPKPPKQDFKEQAPSKHRPITLTNKDLKPQKGPSQEHRIIGDMTYLLSGELGDYEISPKLSSAFHTIESHSDKIGSPMSDREINQIIRELYRADLDLRQVQKNLDRQRSALKAGLDANPPEPQRTNMTNVLNCAQKMGIFVYQLAEYNRMMSRAIKEKDDSDETLVDVVRKAVLVAKSMGSSGACYQALQGSSGR